jgi:hypothetical protein
MKNLFFTAIAIIAFSFAGNAKNLTNNSNVSKSNYNFKKITNDEDCTWKVVKTQRSFVVLADGTYAEVIIKFYKCVDN